MGSKDLNELVEWSCSMGYNSVLCMLIYLKKVSFTTKRMIALGSGCTKMTMMVMVILKGLEREDEAGEIL